MVTKITLNWKDNIWAAPDNKDYSVFADYGHDTVTTGSGNDFLYGFDGNDNLFGGAGNDYIHGGLGQDGMFGGLGNDTYFVDDVKDAVVEDYGNGWGIDTVQTNLKKYTLADSVENLELIAKDHSWGTGNGLDNKITGGDFNDTIDGKGGNDTIMGRDGYDTLFGGKGDDYINGGASNDTLYGGEGKDELYGGFGNDLLHGGEGGDKLYGSVGVDTASYAGSSAGVQIFLDTGGTSGGDAIGDKLYAIENVTGSSFNDWLVGDVKNNVLSGQDGKDWLTGNEGNDTLTGGAGKDKLEGGAGNDTLTGGSGADKLWGGAGADTFVFSGNHGLDKIYDFEDGVDIFYMSSEDFAGLEFVQSNDDVIIMNEDKDSLIWVYDTDVSKITEADFYLI